VARTVCRRAERHALRVTDAPLDESVAVMLTYLNRLSDYLFVLARHCNMQTGTAEILWDTVREKGSTA